MVMRMQTAFCVLATIASFLLILPPAAVAQCEHVKLTASDASEGNRFGLSVAIDGDYAVVAGGGAVYVFHRSGGNWIQQARLDRTGPWVAIRGDRIVIGEIDDNEAAPNAGAAFVLRREGAEWIEEAKLFASDPVPGEAFGRSVSITDDVIVVGDIKDTESAGACYVFRWNGLAWVHEQKLTASDAQPNDDFGLSVSLSGDRVIIGTFQGILRGSDAQVYVFRWNGSVWIEEQKLVASQLQPKEVFGVSVAISGTVAVVGAPAQGGEEDPAGSGSAYTYQYDGATWVEQGRLSIGDGGFPENLFGVSVAMRGHLLVVGASQAPQPGAVGAGTAYLFERVGVTWVERAELIRPDAATFDRFGGTVGVTEEFALVGAESDDDACPDDVFCNSGSAYVFSLSECGVIDASIPALSAWGVGVLALLIFTAGTIILRRRSGMNLRVICERSVPTGT